MAVLHFVAVARIVAVYDVMVYVIVVVEVVVDLNTKRSRWGSSASTAGSIGSRGEEIIADSLKLIKDKSRKMFIKDIR